jgi:hypothetical protein
LPEPSAESEELFKIADMSPVPPKEEPESWSVPELDLDFPKKDSKKSKKNKKMEAIFD